MSYQYEINTNSPFYVRITGDNYNTLYPLNTETNEPFVSYDDALAFANSLIHTLNNPQRFEVWYHIEMTGGDGKIPLGIQNNGTDSIMVAVTVRETEDKESPIRSINDSFRVEIKAQDGTTYDVLLVTLTNGVGSVSYTDSGTKGDILTITIPKDLFVTINESGGISVVNRGSQHSGEIYSVHLIGDTQFVVYRVV